MRKILPTLLALILGSPYIVRSATDSPVSPPRPPPAAPREATPSPSPWPFDVTPDGLPRFVWPFVRFKSPEFSDGLALAHDLAFDGKNYFSRIVIPELNSYLVPREPGAYLWHDPANGEILLKPGTSTGPWRLTESPDRSVRIAAEKAGLAFVYAGTRLVELTRDGRRYRFAYQDRRLTDVTRVETGGAQTLVALNYNAAGLIQSIEAGGQMFDLEYDNVIFLKKLTEIGGQHSASFGYENRRLTFARLTEKTKLELTFVWGSVQSLSPFTLAGPLPPVVVADRLASYAVQSDADGLYVAFRSKINPTQGGTWTLERKTGLIRVRGAHQPSLTGVP